MGIFLNNGMAFAGIVIAPVYDSLMTTYTTKLIDTTPEQFNFTAWRECATKSLNHIADITVNGHSETADRPTP